MSNDIDDAHANSLSTALWTVQVECRFCELALAPFGQKHIIDRSFAAPGTNNVLAKTGPIRLVVDLDGTHIAVKHLATCLALEVNQQLRLFLNRLHRYLFRSSPAKRVCPTICITCAGNHLSE